MDKYINGLIYGTTKTKIYLWSLTGILMGDVFSFVFSIILSSPGLWFLTALLTLIAIIMIRSAEFYIEEFEKDKKSSDSMKGMEKEMNGLKLKSEQKKDRMVEGTIEYIDSKEASKKYRQDRRDRVVEGAIEYIDESQKKRENKAVSGTLEYYEEYESKQEKKKVKGFSTEEIVDTDEQRETSMDRQADESIFNKKLIKKLIRKYGGKKENYPVLIDEYVEESVFRCPAFIWKDKKYLYFLVIEANPRVFKLEIDKMTKMRRVDNVPAEMEYPEWSNKSFLGMVFNPLMPDIEKVSNGKQIKLTKSLYAVNSNIMLTKKSMANLLKLVDLELVIDNPAILSVDYSEYYRQVYKLRIFYKDDLIGREEYNNKLKEVLYNMASANLELSVFHGYLAAILRDGLVSKESGEYALAVRKNRRIHIDK